MSILQESGQSAANQTDTIRVKNRAALEREHEIAEELARERERDKSRDPAFLARICLPPLLPLQALIGHDDFIRNVGPEGMVTEGYLRSFPYLLSSKHFAGLISRLKFGSTDKMNPQMHIDEFTYWRPNKFQPILTQVDGILLDGDEWVERRVKGQKKVKGDMFVSSYKYARQMEIWIGERYRTIAERTLLVEWLIGERKRYGGDIQDIQKETLSPTWSARAKWLNDDLEVGKEMLIKSMRPQSIITESEFRFVYNAGNLVHGFLGESSSDVGKLEGQQKEMLISSCIEDLVTS